MSFTLPRRLPRSRITPRRLLPSAAGMEDNRTEPKPMDRQKPIDEDEEGQWTVECDCMKGCVTRAERKEKSTAAPKAAEGEASMEVWEEEAPPAEALTEEDPTAEVAAMTQPLTPPPTPPATALGEGGQPFRISGTHFYARYDDPPNEAAEGAMMSEPTYEGIKTVIYHLLNLVLIDYREERCEGCKIRHPSQRRHECLQEELQDYFFGIHFGQIAKRLFNDRFIPIVQKLLQGRNIRVDDVTICTASQTLLHELRAEARVTKPLTDMYDQLQSNNMGNFVTNPETDPDFLRWIDHMDSLSKRRVSESVDTDERFSALDKLFIIIANVNDKWAEIVKHAVELGGEGVSDKIGKVLAVWSLDAHNYKESHILALYTLFVDVACHILKKGQLVNVPEELKKLQRLVEKHLKPQAVRKALAIITGV